ncbi:MAG: ATP-binding cassette domain-containing protein [Candidatus Eremiobacteraeota bacterium]|nr:ATP-binding cassette domain-containing protein [Candidatus Eremiobacteraeota bacterium]MCW5872201.1 ATP-binding cassette domain-containing protein [Candidatus Eremiobacteraeota bacterium]
MIHQVSTPARGVPLVVEGLTKFYGSTRALQEVSLEVPQGSIFGVLGPNGSGKTTLLGIVLDILLATRGTYRWAPGLKRGALLETPNFYPYLTGRENLAIVAELRGRGRDRIGDALTVVGLDSYEAMPFAKYSLGMKQRLAIGATMIGNPEVVVLDEPTNGLDPAGIADVRELIRGLRNEGKTVLLASHMLDEVEKVCTHVAILKKGQVLSQGLLEDVLRDEDRLEVRSDDLEALQALLQKHPLNPKVQPGDGYLTVAFEAGAMKPADLNRYCLEGGQTLGHLVLRKKTLESRFLELTD